MADEQDRSKLADQRTEWSERRTDLAEDRTIQATERTFAGWIRTALAGIGVGVAFHALFGDFEPPWLARAIATLFIAVAAIVAFTAGLRTRRTFERLHSHSIDAPKAPRLMWISWSVVVGALVLIAALWLSHDGGP